MIPKTKDCYRVGRKQEGKVVKYDFKKNTGNGLFKGVSVLNCPIVLSLSPSTEVSKPWIEDWLKLLRPYFDI